MVIRSIGVQASDRDVIGERGEYVAMLALTEAIGARGRLFRPRLLGEKHPTIDLLVELVNAPVPITPFFFAQVKATRAGYTATGNLKVQMTNDMVRRLVAYPAPTYIIGVDDSVRRHAKRGTSYIVAAMDGGASHYSSLSTAHPIGEQTLEQLYDEVLGFWQIHPAAFTTSAFR